MISDQFQSGNPSQRNACLDEFHKVLKDPKFQVLESEYQLSQRLSLVCVLALIWCKIMKHFSFVNYTAIIIKRKGRNKCTKTLPMSIRELLLCQIIHNWKFIFSVSVFKGLGLTLLVFWLWIGREGFEIINWTFKTCSIHVKDS